MAWPIDIPHYDKLFVIGATFSPNTLDPHATEEVANHALASHVFDSLFTVDKNGNAHSDLVKQFNVVGDTEWTFTLYENIRFHDETELTADDVVASLQRLQGKLKGSLTLNSTAFKVMGRYTFRASTKEAVPDLPRQLDEPAFIIKKSAAGASQHSFDNGSMVIGTGPYRLVRQDNMRSFEFTAFEHYHSAQPYLQHVRMDFGVSAPERLQQFMEGKIDLIDNLNDKEVDIIQAAQQANFTIPLGKTAYLMVPDVYRDQSPDITDHAGQPLPQNPLKDVRVRKAISRAVDRDALVNSFYGRSATITGQLQAMGAPGYSSALKPDAQNIEEAKQLLDAAGYPAGFRIVLHDKDTRRALAEAIAGMLQKISIDVRVEALPAEVFFKGVYEYSYSLTGILYSQDGDLGAMLRNLIYSKSPYNWGRYQNAEIDALLLQANREFNDTARTRHYRYIDELAMQDAAVIPLFFYSTIWAIRPDMTYDAPATDFTEAYYVKPELGGGVK